jgi:hypothetical protein
MVSLWLLLASLWHNDFKNVIRGSKLSLNQCSWAK